MPESVRVSPRKGSYGSALSAAMPIVAFAFSVGAGFLTPVAAGGQEISGVAAEAGSAAESLTLAQCVDLARHRAPAVTAARLDRSSAASDSVATSSNRRPDFSLRTGALVAPKGFYDPAMTNLGEYELRAGLEWGVADGGRRARERQRSGLGLAAARSRLQLESLEAGRHAAELALDLLRSTEVESIERGAFDWLVRLDTLVRVGVASGARGSSDSIRIALEREQVVADLEASRLDRETTSLELATLIGRELSVSLAIVDTSTAVARDPAPADSIRLLASVSRQPGVALARLSDSSAQLDVLDAQHLTAPEVDLSLDAGLWGSDLTAAVPDAMRIDDPSATFADRLRRDLGASAAIRFRLPVLDVSVRPARDAREAALGASQVRSKSAELNERALALSLFARWRSASRRTRAAQETSDRAQNNLLKLKSLYAAGATTLLDLLDARRVYDAARQRLAEARWDQRLAQFLVEDRIGA